MSLQLYFKRFFDLFMSFFLLIILFPIILVIFLTLYFSQKGQVFFKQIRPGKNEKLFVLLKFKTMRDAFDDANRPLPDSERLTEVGKWVRRLSLDELPQLLNVIKGDMSLIGPRPLLVEYLPLYSDVQKLRHTMRPGITGLAQVNGRNSITWKEKFEFDVLYVKNYSLMLDLKIFVLTIFRVLSGKGISMEGHATAEKFRGNG
jgi:undecaprenyl phosphate N,N'-diacetylbacillosamine 1-phosphate transferase